MIKSKHQLIEQVQNKSISDDAGTANDIELFAELEL
jgi:hypothetical protein